MMLRTPNSSFELADRAMSVDPEEIVVRIQRGVSMERGLDGARERSMTPYGYQGPPPPSSMRQSHSSRPRSPPRPPRPSPRSSQEEAPRYRRRWNGGRGGPPRRPPPRDIRDVRPTRQRERDGDFARPAPRRPHGKRWRRFDYDRPRFVGGNRGRGRGGAYAGRKRRRPDGYSLRNEEDDYRDRRRQRNASRNLDLQYITRRSLVDRIALEMYGEKMKFNVVLVPKYFTVTCLIQYKEKKKILLKSEDSDLDSDSDSDSEDEIMLDEEMEDEPMDIDLGNDGPPKRRKKTTQDHHRARNRDGDRDRNGRADAEVEYVEHEEKFVGEDSFRRYAFEDASVAARKFLDQKFQRACFESVSVDDATSRHEIGQIVAEWRRCAESCSTDHEFVRRAHSICRSVFPYRCQYRCEPASESMWRVTCSVGGFEILTSDKKKRIAEFSAVEELLKEFARNDQLRRIYDLDL